MTNELSKYDPFSIGFDRMWKSLDEITKVASKTTFPPYNIRQISENEYVIEMAVAGFGKSDITITLEEDNLIIKGESSISEEDSDNSFIHRGIANRNFIRNFKISDDVKIENAEMINGMLKIFLDRIIPDHKKPKNIEIK